LNDASFALVLETAEAFEPLLKASRYKGAWGGRGSGKSHFFAELLVEECIANRGFRAVCVREIQKSLKESAKRLIEDKIQAHQVGHLFKVLETEIRTPGGGTIIFQGLQDHTAESIKSLEGFDRCWVEEGQALSQRSWDLLRPTIRKPGSEIWVSWNPRRAIDPVDKFLRLSPPADAIVVKANWRDNPWFPAVLEQERSHDFTVNPDGYGHIWEGEYVTVVAGAYYAKALTQARLQGRICRVTADPLMSLRTFHDIGGSGAKADAYAIWVVQFVGREIRVLDYYESRGQVLAHHVNWMRQRGYDQAEVVLPHDGVNANNVTGKKYEDHWREAGFSVKSIPNQGSGAATQRIEAARRLFPSMWFNEQTTEAGRAALGWYHEKIDEERNVGLGPDHDWSSHGADAFGLMAVAYDAPRAAAEAPLIPEYGTMA
jgi:phage terminase large subunit